MTVLQILISRANIPNTEIVHVPKLKREAIIPTPPADLVAFGLVETVATTSLIVAVCGFLCALGMGAF